MIFEKNILERNIPSKPIYSFIDIFLDETFKCCKQVSKETYLANICLLLVILSSNILKFKRKLYHILDGHQSKLLKTALGQFS